MELGLPEREPGLREQSKWIPDFALTSWEYTVRVLSIMRRQVFLGRSTSYGQRVLHI